MRQAYALLPTLTIGFLLAAASPTAAASIGPITRVTPDLYTAQRDDGLHFVMERVDAGATDGESRVAFWIRFAAEELTMEREYRALWRTLSPDLKQLMPLKVVDPHRSLAGGVLGFQRAMENEREAMAALSEPSKHTGAGTEQKKPSRRLEISKE